MDKIRCTDIIGGHLGHKKAKNGSYIILIEQQVQHHLSVNDFLIKPFWMDEISFTNKFTTSLAKKRL